MSQRQILITLTDDVDEWEDETIEWVKDRLTWILNAEIGKHYYTIEEFRK